MKTQKEIEDAIMLLASRPGWKAVETEYERMLKILGNVNGNEVVLLSILAFCQKTGDVDIECSMR